MSSTTAAQKVTLARRISRWNRERKWQLFQRLFSPGPAMTVLDVGFSPRDRNPSDNYLEKHYPYLEKVTALRLADGRRLERQYPGVTVVEYDGGVMPFADNQFDIVWSNAVVEHVGTPDDQAAFLRELDRVGRYHFVTTPNRWYPVEPHTRTPFVHWLPKTPFDAYLRRVGKDWATGGYMALLSARQFRARLAEAGVGDARLIRNRLAGPTLDFVAVW